MKTLSISVGREEGHCDGDHGEHGHGANESHMEYGGGQGGHDEHGGHGHGDGAREGHGGHGVDAGHGHEALERIAFGPGVQVTLRILGRVVNVRLISSAGFDQGGYGSHGGGSHGSDATEVDLGHGHAGSAHSFRKVLDEDKKPTR